MKICLASIRMLLVLTFLTGVIYPLLITVVGQFFWPDQAMGSLIRHNNVVIGSELLAQKFTLPKYFHSRPSACDYATVPSGASNLGPTSQALADLVQKRRDELGGAGNLPPELLTASGSGLDPHLSVEAIRFQAQRVAEARHIEKIEDLDKLIASHIINPLFGSDGMKLINVLQLNIALDQAFP